MFNRWLTRATIWEAGKPQSVVVFLRRGNSDFTSAARLHGSGGHGHGGRSALMEPPFRHFSERSFDPRPAATSPAPPPLPPPPRDPDSRGPMVSSWRESQWFAARLSTSSGRTRTGRRQRWQNYWSVVCLTMSPSCGSLVLYLIICVIRNEIQTIKLSNYQKGHLLVPVLSKTRAIHITNPTCGIHMLGWHHVCFLSRCYYQY